MKTANFAFAVLLLTLAHGKGAEVPEPDTYGDRLAFAEVQVASGFTLSRVAMESLPFTGAELLDERATTGSVAAGKSTREDLLQLRKDTASLMATLENPPAEYADAYQQLLAMYSLYVKLSGELLDTSEPRPLPEVEIQLLTQRFDHLRRTLRALSPAVPSQ